MSVSKTIWGKVPSGTKDVKSIYAKWASSYDYKFADDWGYAAPKKIANIFRENYEGSGLILDVGAGTGLVGENLLNFEVDALDLSKEMLGIAKHKKIYKNLLEEDLTKPLNIQDKTYSGIISCGTFTHGLVGPECLDELLRITKSGALFCCGTIYTVFDELGFGSALARLVARKIISPVDFREIKIYAKNHHPHSNDIGLVFLFKKI